MTSGPRPLAAEIPVGINPAAEQPSPPVSGGLDRATSISISLQPMDNISLRVDRVSGYAHQRLYMLDGKSDLILTVRDQDVVLVREGYHPTVAGHGYNLYFLNYIAGSARSMANTEDPNHSWVKSTWKEIDPRLPLVARDGR